MPKDSTPSEIWDNILKGDVKKDDPLWTVYLDKAAEFDKNMVKELNKIVDVLLVFVALLIAVLTSFILTTLTQLQRNPADITNDLLVAIYNQLAAQSNNTSIPSVDPRSYFNQSKADYDAAVIRNALLYTTLSLSIVVSVMALLAKLWLVNYSSQVFSAGSPYDRAMKRQEAYNGALVWNMKGLINILPFILIVILYLFGFYVYMSIYALHHSIGVAVEVLLCLGVLGLSATTLAAAVIPGCPFRSVVSDVLQFLLESFQRLFKRCRNPKVGRWLWNGTLAFIWIVFCAGAGYAALKIDKYMLIFSGIPLPVVYSAQQEPDHKPQKYKILHLVVWACLFAVLTVILSMCFDSLTFILLYTTGVLGIGFLLMVIGKMAKSMTATGEIDAMAWLLITDPPEQPAKFFKKAGQMTDDLSIGHDYRPRLLQSLMPHLTDLITSYHAPGNDTHHTSSSELSKTESKGEKSGDGRPTNQGDVDNDKGHIDDLENVEIYTACLARLSDFTDSKGGFWCLREDARQHPELEELLVKKLVWFVNHSQDVLKRASLERAAAKVLDNYKLDKEGHPKLDPATGVEPAHSSEEVKGVKRVFGMC